MVGLLEKCLGFFMGFFLILKLALEFFWLFHRPILKKNTFSENLLILSVAYLSVVYVLIRLMFPIHFHKLYLEVC